MRNGARMDVEPRKVRRIRPLRWRDTRLWIGIGLVVSAMFIGARVLTVDSDRTLVWAATGDMAVGAAPSKVALVPVALGDAAALYLGAEQRPTGQLLIPIRRGTLIPRDALDSEVLDLSLRFVTVAVEPASAPPQISAGHLVDVWSTGEDGEATLVLDAMVVHDVAGEPGGVRTGIHVVLQVASAEVAPLLAAMRGGAIDLVAVPVRP
jgi:hypothetical protein